MITATFITIVSGLLGIVSDVKGYLQPPSFWLLGCLTGMAAWFCIVQNFP